MCWHELFRRRALTDAWLWASKHCHSCVHFSLFSNSFFSEISIVLPLSHLSCHPLLPLSLLSSPFFHWSNSPPLHIISPSPPFSSDWLLWCSGRVTGLCGPWSYLALTACYLHGDGWLRRCRASLLTTAEDREHTWDTSPTLTHLLALSFCRFSHSFSPLSLNFFAFPSFSFSGSTLKSCWGATR